MGVGDVRGRGRWECEKGTQLCEGWHVHSHGERGRGRGKTGEQQVARVCRTLTSGLAPQVVLLRLVSAGRLKGWVGWGYRRGGVILEKQQCQRFIGLRTRRGHCPSFCVWDTRVKKRTTQNRKCKNEVKMYKISAVKQQQLQEVAYVHSLLRNVKTYILYHWAQYMQDVHTSIPPRPVLEYA